jgi:hypothetical protein
MESWHISCAVSQSLGSLRVGQPASGSGAYGETCSILTVLHTAGSERTGGDHYVAARLSVTPLDRESFASKSGQTTPVSAPQSRGSSAANTAAHATKYAWSAGIIETLNESPSWPHRLDSTMRALTAAFAVLGEAAEFLHLVDRPTAAALRSAGAHWQHASANERAGRVAVLRPRGATDRQVFANSCGPLAVKLIGATLDGTLPDTAWPRPSLGTDTTTTTYSAADDDCPRPLRAVADREQCRAIYERANRRAEIHLTDASLSVPFAPVENYGPFAAATAPADKIYRTMARTLFHAASDSSEAERSG